MNSENQDKDPNVCPSFEKTGCCSKGDRCNKVHNIPAFARTVIFHHIFPNPDFFINCLPDGVIEMSDEEKQRYIDAFFLDCFLMLRKFGKIEDMIIAGNTLDCLSGNLYVFFAEADVARIVVTAFDGQYYAGRKIHVSLCGVPRVTLALCKQSIKGECPKGAECAFIHALEPSFALYSECFNRAGKVFPDPLRKGHIPPVRDNPNEIISGVYRNPLQTMDMSKHIPPGFPGHDPTKYKQDN